MDVFAEEDWDGENDRSGYRHKVTEIGEPLGNPSGTGATAA
jgi:hypothetical protein